MRYYILCACQLCVSYGLVYLVTSVLSFLGQVIYGCGKSYNRYNTFCDKLPDTEKMGV